MTSAYLFRWGIDTYIMRANWGDASSPILVNGRHIPNNVGYYNHDPKKVARTFMEECAVTDGEDVESEEVQKKIQKQLDSMN